jgi:hypothetical protein
MINKQVFVVLTQEEIDSPEPIEIKLVVLDEEGDHITYTIKYPKDGFKTNQTTKS